MFDLLKEIWQTMRTNKLRTFLTGLSVAWGIFMLILLLSIANGVVNSTRDSFEQNDPYYISIWGGYTAWPSNGLKEGRHITLRERGVVAIEDSKNKHIDNVTALMNIAGTVSTSRDYLTTSVVGVYPTFFDRSFAWTQGRPLNDADIKELRKSIVLCSNDLTTLFDDTTNVVGKTVKIGSLGFTVIGVYNHPWHDTSYIPFSTAQAISGYKDEYNQVDVHMTGISSTEESEQVVQDIKHALGRAENFNPDDPSAVFTWNRFSGYVQQQKGTMILTYAMWIIGLLTLITGIVGVSNIMFVSVRERTHEIGIRRAIGAKPRNILTQVVLESIVLTTGFGYIGIVMGTLATEIVKKAFANNPIMLNPSVDLHIALEVTVALIIAGALAGIFPAMRAIKVSPVEALRDE